MDASGSLVSRGETVVLASTRKPWHATIRCNSGCNSRMYCCCCTAALLYRACTIDTPPLGSGDLWETCKICTTAACCGSRENGLGNVSTRNVYGFLLAYLASWRTSRKNPPRIPVHTWRPMHRVATDSVHSGTCSASSFKLAMLSSRRITYGRRLREGGFNVQSPKDGPDLRVDNL